MTVMGIDLGDKRCGIAIEVNNFCFPKEIVARVKIIATIKNYSLEYKIDTIVVGLPYDLYGKKTKQLEKTKGFINKIQKIFPDKKIVGVDERFTSFEAESITSLISHHKEKKEKRDDISAQLILESYIKKR